MQRRSVSRNFGAVPPRPVNPKRTPGKKPKRGAATTLNTAPNNRIQRRPRSAVRPHLEMPHAAPLMRSVRRLPLLAIRPFTRFICMIVAREVVSQLFPDSTADVVAEARSIVQDADDR